MQPYTIDDEYFTVAVVRASGDIERAVQCNDWPSPAQFNLLYTLGEHINRVISVDDICHRLMTTENALRQHACALRKKLHYDWSIESLSNKGLRLVYLGSHYAEVNHVEVRKPPPRPRHYHSSETRQKIRDTQIKNKAYLNFKRVAV